MTLAVLSSAALATLFLTFAHTTATGVKENLASASKKLDRALGKLALLTRTSKDGQERGCAVVMLACNKSLRDFLFTDAK